MQKLLRISENRLKICTEQAIAFVLNEGTLTNDEEIASKVEGINQELFTGQIKIISADEAHSALNESTDQEDDGLEFFMGVNANEKPSGKKISEPHYELTSTGHKKDVTGKNDKVLEYILYLEPSSLICPGAGNCAASCLINTGKHKISAIQRARKTKTDEFRNLKTHNEFMSKLERDLILFQTYAEQEKQAGNIQGYFVRLNGTSDIPIEYFRYYKTRDEKNILQLFPNMTFVDYTKVYKGGKGTSNFLNGKIRNNFGAISADERKNALAKMTGNYDIYKSGKYPNYFAVYSYDGPNHESNDMDCEQILSEGGVVAMIFDTYMGRLPMPKTYNFHGKDYRVVIGDFSDAIHLAKEKYDIGDEEGLIIGLSFKTAYGEKLGYNIGKNDKYKFPNVIDLAKYYRLDRNMIWALKNKSAKDFQKNLWPLLAKNGYSFYNYRFTTDTSQDIPHFEKGKNGKFDFHPMNEPDLMEPKDNALYDLLAKKVSETILRKLY